MAIEHGETKLVLTRKVPHYWLAFTVLEGTMCSAGGKSSTVLAREPCEFQELGKNKTHGYKTDKDIMGITHAWYLL